MKSFFKKYLGLMISLALVILLLFWSFRFQDKYYLESDVNEFKKKNFMKLLIWTGAVITLLAAGYSLLSTRSLPEAGKTMLIAALSSAGLLFTMQALLLGAALFLNRSLAHETMERNYVVGYLREVDSANSRPLLSDVATGKIVSDEHFPDRLMLGHPLQNDTVSVRFQQGIFGVPCEPTLIRNKGQE